MMKTMAKLLVGAMMVVGTARAQVNNQLKNAMVEIARLSETLETSYDPKGQRGRTVSGANVYVSGAGDFVTLFVTNFRNGGLVERAVQPYPRARVQLRNVNTQLDLMLANANGSAGPDDGNLPLDAQYQAQHAGTTAGQWDTRYEMPSEQAPNFAKAQAACNRLKATLRNALRAFRDALKTDGGKDAEKIVTDATAAYYLAGQKKDAMRKEDRWILENYR